MALLPTLQAKPVHHSNSSVSKIFDDVVEHHLAHVLQEQRIGDAVSRLRLQHQLKLFPCLLQLVDELDRVLHVHVVVNRAVNQ